MYSRYVNVGLYYLRQVFFAKYDIKVHTDKGMLPISPCSILYNVGLIVICGRTHGLYQAVE